MSLSSKLGLYDFLNFFVVGSLLMIILCPDSLFEEHTCCKACCSSRDSVDIVLPFLFGVFAYLLGLVWHHMTDMVLSMLFRSSRKCQSTRLINLLRAFDRNNIEMIKDQYKFEENAETSPQNVVLHSNGCISRRYLFEYYYLQKNGQLGNIPVLEAQEAFTRNIILPLLLLAVTTFCTSGNIWGKIVETYFGTGTCCLGICILILMFVVIIVHCKIQKKVYQLVIEGSHYLSSLDSMSSKNDDSCSCKRNSI